jgi:hypothetical protein
MCVCACTQTQKRPCCVPWLALMEAWAGADDAVRGRAAGGGAADLLPLPDADGGARVCVRAYGRGHPRGRDRRAVRCNQCGCTSRRVRDYFDWPGPPGGARRHPRRHRPPQGRDPQGTRTRGTVRRAQAQHSHACASLYTAGGARLYRAPGAVGGGGAGRVCAREPGAHTRLRVLSACGARLSLMRPPCRPPSRSLRPSKTCFPTFT